MAKDRRQAWEVHLDAPELGAKARVGTLYRPVVRTDLAASFAYDPAWLKAGKGWCNHATRRRCGYRNRSTLSC